MPALIDPETRSPGNLYLRYQGLVAYALHTCSLNYVAGAFPVDRDAAESDATAFAAQVGNVLRPAAFLASDWWVTNELNQMIFKGSFAVPVPGSATPDAEASDYLSATISFTGRGIPGSTVLGAGQTRITLVNGGTYAIAPGQTRITDIAGTALLDFIAWLDGHPKLWADFYGQKAASNGYVNVQFNARTQRKYGS